MSNIVRVLQKILFVINNMYPHFPCFFVRYRIK
nr:MAG TPA: hypothetical protein [Caudoviricetes sp.]